MSKLFDRGVVAVRDAFRILRGQLELLRKDKQRDFTRITGVPVNVLGDFKRNQGLLEKVRERFPDQDDTFEEIIAQTADAMLLVGSNFETDLYFDRSIIEGGREKDAYRFFLVGRRELDRGLLMVLTDRDKVDPLSLRENRAPSNTDSDSIFYCEGSRRGKTLSVVDDQYSSTAIQQAEYYFDMLFQEESIIHVLSNNRTIVSILNLPYELPGDVYKRKPYSTESPRCLTEFVVSAMAMEASTTSISESPATSQ